MRSGEHKKNWSCLTVRICKEKKKRKNHNQRVSGAVAWGYKGYRPVKPPPSAHSPPLSSASFPPLVPGAASLKCESWPGRLAVGLKPPKCIRYLALVPGVSSLKSTCSFLPLLDKSQQQSRPPPLQPQPPPPPTSPPPLPSPSCSPCFCYSSTSSPTRIDGFPCSRHSNPPQSFVRDVGYHCAPRRSCQCWVSGHPTLRRRFRFPSGAHATSHHPNSSPLA